MKPLQESLFGFPWCHRLDERDVSREHRKQLRDVFAPTGHTITRAIANERRKGQRLGTVDNATMLSEIEAVRLERQAFDPPCISFGDSASGSPEKFGDYSRNAAECHLRNVVEKAGQCGRSRREPLAEKSPLSESDALGAVDAGKKMRNFGLRERPWREGTIRTNFGRNRRSDRAHAATPRRAFHSVAARIA
ncbi:MAG: hypothetical protein ACSLFQ_10155 [Thermoanaerobaculia bacterium]